MRYMVNLSLASLLILVSVGVYHTIDPTPVELPELSVSGAGTTRSGLPPLSREPAGRYRSLSSKNLFHPDRRSPDEEIRDEAGGDGTTATAEPPRGVILMGTVIAGPYKVAFIKNPKDKKTGVGRYEVGQTVQEFDIVDILPDRVVMRKGADLAELELNVPKGTTRKARGSSRRSRAEQKSRDAAKGSRSSSRQKSGESGRGSTVSSRSGSDSRGKAGLSTREKKEMEERKEKAKESQGRGSQISGRRNRGQTDGELPAPFEAIFGGSGSRQSGRR